MRTTILLACAISWFATSLPAQKLYPYTLGAVSSLDIQETAMILKESLEKEGFLVLGEYMPADDKDRRAIIISSDELIAAASKVGGLAGFAGALRVGLTKESGKIKISYTSPEYWMNAYYRDDYDKVSAGLAYLSQKLETAMKASGSWSGTGFGSVGGLEQDKLRNYRYMAGMPKFHNTVELAVFDSHQDAIDKVESSLIKGVPDVKKVYSLEIPGKELKLYGFALSGEKGESNFLPTIDISEPKHTAFLPYEFLIMGNEVHMLHGRYRIAVSFPDLTMGTFTKIMSSPGDIKDLLKSVVE